MHSHWLVGRSPRSVIHLPITEAVVHYRSRLRVRFLTVCFVSAFPHSLLSPLLLLFLRSTIGPTRASRSLRSLPVMKRRSSAPRASSQRNITINDPFFRFSLTGTDIRKVIDFGRSFRITVRSTCIGFALSLCCSLAFCFASSFAVVSLALARSVSLSLSLFSLPGRCGLSS